MSGIVPVFGIWYNKVRILLCESGGILFYLNAVEKKAVTEFTSRIKDALGANLFDIRLFGSKATGKFTDDSDIDVLVIVRNRDEETFDIISEILLDVELKYDCLISPVVFSVLEFSQNQEHQTLFYNEVARDGVAL